MYGGTYMNCDGLESIQLPNNVTEIGKGAFINCKKIESITIPDGVQKIRERTFYNCEKLKSIQLPNTVTEIGKDAFMNCKGLVSIHLPPDLIEIGEEAFMNCEKLEYITIPYNQDYIKIQKRTFRNCHSLKEVNIPANIKTIGKEAFSSCTALETFTLPEPDFTWSIPDNTWSIFVIQDCAFSGCTNLKTVQIENVTYLGKGAFGHCYELTSVSMPLRLDWLRNSQNRWPFRNSFAIKDVTINDRTVEHFKNHEHFSHCALQCVTFIYMGSLPLFGEPDTLDRLIPFLKTPECATVKRIKFIDENEYESIGGGWENQEKQFICALEYDKNKKNKIRYTHDDEDMNNEIVSEVVKHKQCQGNKEQN